MNDFTIVILDMDSAPHVEYSDVVLCGAFAVKQLSDSTNKLDEFIKKSQLQTNFANDVYLEWIPYNCIDGYSLYGLPFDQFVQLIPLEITDSTHDSYYAEVNYLLMRQVYWIVQIIIDLLLCIVSTSYVITIQIFLSQMFGLPSDSHMMQANKSII